jgi:hypothetical protein
MQKTRQVSLYLAIIFWAIITGGVFYSHIVYFPAYLAHLPQSNQLITGKYALHDENFWSLIHPFAILFTIVTLILNWKLKERRTFILIPAVIYALAIFFTTVYFVPELRAFAESNNNSSTPSVLFQRGQTWQHRSWIRGSFIFVGFIMLLIALQKNERTSVN